MKVTYIYHSSFCVELDHVILLFDYYKGELPKFKTEKSIYVFASHKHYDHFDKRIFQLALEYPKIQFILSHDIKMNEKYMERMNIPKEAWDKIRYVRGKEEYVFGNEIELVTLKSTDVGVAFLITTQEMKIYHAGDLNWWTWKGETKEEYESMTKAFCEEIDTLKNLSIDVAFLPLDPRQEDRFYLGFDYFMRHTNTKRAYPMHFWEQPEYIDKLLGMDVSNSYRQHIIKLEKEGFYDEF